MFKLKLRFYCLKVKWAFCLQIVAKPAVRVTAGPSPQIKMDVDDHSSLKRKREEDDYDM